MHSSFDSQLALARLEHALLVNLNLLEALREGLERFENPAPVIAEAGHGGRQELAHRGVQLPRGELQRGFLEESTQRISELAIPSLAGNPVVTGGLLESRHGLGGLARIRICEAPGRALIFVDALAARSRRKLLRKHLPQRLALRLLKFQADAVAWKEPATIAAFAICVDNASTWTLNVSVTRVALAFIEARMALMADLGDFTREPVLELTAPVRPRSHGRF